MIIEAHAERAEADRRDEAHCTLDFGGSRHGSVESRSGTASQRSPCVGIVGCIHTFVKLHGIALHVGHEADSRILIGVNFVFELDTCQDNVYYSFISRPFDYSTSVKNYQRQRPTTTTYTKTVTEQYSIVNYIYINTHV